MIGPPIERCYDPMMRRSRLAPLALGVLVTACSTYRRDLDRAVEHYKVRQYDKALVLFEVLEPDLDSFSKAERAQYAYYRGQSHFFLEQRRDARHWIGRALAREKNDPNSLQPEEFENASETITVLNRAVYGGPSADISAGARCESDRDCTKGSFCDAGVCRASMISPTGSASAAPSAAPPPQ
ncbi:MAG: hypothetical protein AAGA56_29790 [Myxococcota bacterium]